MPIGLGNPVGIVLAALLLGALRNGATNMEQVADSIVAAMVVDPEIMTSSGEYYVDVETSGERSL